MSVVKHHILLVEDNADHAELLRRNLEHMPAKCLVHHVEDGEAALDYLLGRRGFEDRTHFPMPDLVLLDLRLPRLDGMEVLRLVKKQPETARIPIVVLSTSDAEKDVSEAMALKADRFLTKPADGPALIQVLTSFGFMTLTGAATPLTLPITGT